MDNWRLSGSQRGFARLLGAEAAAAMKAESRAWLIVCPDCGFARSVWEPGGVRYKASGTSRVGMACPRCGRTGWQRIEKGPGFPAATGPVWPLVRLILAAVILIALFVAATLFALLELIG
jgi:predicted RNA-binding Zn-ribbon protein involved in translation (DUF1610 family)